MFAVALFITPVIIFAVEDAIEAHKHAEAVANVKLTPMEKIRKGEGLN